MERALEAAGKKINKSMKHDIAAMKEAFYK
jgi:hypothetical protein